MSKTSESNRFIGVFTICWKFEHRLFCNFIVCGHLCLNPIHEWFCSKINLPHIENRKFGNFICIGFNSSCVCEKWVPFAHWQGKMLADLFAKSLDHAAIFSSWIWGDSNEWCIWWSLKRIKALLWHWALVQQARYLTAMTYLWIFATFSFGPYHHQ